jgi:hypothetical protein
MDGIELLLRATQAGLTVQVVDGRLKIKGPKTEDSLANLLIANKTEVMAALAAAAPGCFCDSHTTGDGDETSKSSGLAGVSSPAQALQPAIEATDCGSVHIQPQRWDHRDGRAYCPGCGRFMGYVRGEP